ncbi:MAG: YdgA family protein [Woeseia sp.]
MFVVVLVALALIILISPGIVGRLAEENLKMSLRWVESEGEDVRVVEESFRRGWFTAEGRHRIELERGELRSAVLDFAGQAEGNRDNEHPALIIDTRIDHGLVPLTSMARQSGSLLPALASTHSTLQLDPGDGNIVDIPGNVYSRVGLFGETASRYLAGPGTFDNDGQKAEWGAADIAVTANPSSGRVQWQGTVEGMSFVSGGDFAEVGSMRSSGDVAPGGFGFTVGSIELDIESLMLRQGQSPDNGAKARFEDLVLDARSEVDGDRVNANSTLKVAGIAVPGFGDAEINVDVAVSGLDGSSLRTIITALQDAAGRNGANVALYPQVNTDLQRLLAFGGELRINRLDFALPQGDLTTRMLVTLPETAADGRFSVPAMLLALTASADLRIPVALIEVVQAGNPQFGALVAMGFLKRDGDAYVLQAEYEKGLLTVNGAPMPIPLRGR